MWKVNRHQTPPDSKRSTLTLVRWATSMNQRLTRDCIGHMIIHPLFGFKQIFKSPFILSILGTSGLDTGGCLVARDKKILVTSPIFFASVDKYFLLSDNSNFELLASMDKLVRKLMSSLVLCFWLSLSILRSVVKKIIIYINFANFSNVCTWTIDLLNEILFWLRSVIIK